MPHDIPHLTMLEEVTDVLWVSRRMELRKLGFCTASSVLRADGLISGHGVGERCESGVLGSADGRQKHDECITGCPILAFLMGKRRLHGILPKLPPAALAQCLLRPFLQPLCPLETGLHCCR